MARTYLYLENWDEARNYAEQALKIAGITTLTNDANAYKALYNSEISNSESMFALAITNTTTGQLIHMELCGLHTTLVLVLN